MTTVSGILLAAGESRRMGMVNKLMLPVAGEPLVRRTARTLAASRLREVVVVLGQDGAEVGEQLADLPVRVVRNARYRDGQMRSVHCGLEALTETRDGIMIVLADQPLLTDVDINVLIAAFGALGPDSILVPSHAGQRGNPVIVAASHRRAILAEGPGSGCRQFIDRHPELVARLDMTDDHVVFDLDTPQDYERLQQRLETAPQVKQI